MTEQELRDSYARSIATRGGTERSSCVSPEAIASLVQREGPEAARLTTLDHVMSCDACRREFDLLSVIERAGTENARRAVEKIHWRRYASAALAASVLLAIGLGPGRRLWDHSVDTVTRGSDEAAIVLVAPAERAAAAGSATFVWRGIRGARHYTVELLDDGGRLMFSRQTSDTSMTVDRIDVAPGDYQWLVRTTAEDGVERRSAPRAIHVAAGRGQRSQ